MCISKNIVNSYIVVETDNNGHCVMSVVNEVTAIPESAEEVTGSFVFNSNTSTSVYHRPDCTWFTKSTI